MAMLMVTVAGGAVAAVARILDRDLAGVAGVAVGTVVLFMFWRWIQIGADHRLRAPDGSDPDDPVRSVGPWGIVGAVLTVLVLGGLIAFGIWSTVSLRGDRDRAETARDEAVAAAKQQKLDVDSLRPVHARRLAASWDGEPDGDELADLLPLEHGRITDLSIEGETASLLVRPDGGGPPCAVVDIVHGDLIRGRLSNDC